MEKQMKKIKDGTTAQTLAELRWISGYGRKYLFVILWNILLGIVGAVLGLWASVLSKDIIDIVTGRQTGYVLQTAVFYVVMQLVKIGLNAIAGRISERLRLRVSQFLRADIFQKILAARWEPLSQYHSGDLMARSNRDVEAVAGCIMGWAPSLIVNSLQLLGSFLVLFWYDKTLALLALASAPVTVLVSGLLARRIRKHSQRMRQVGSEMTSFYAESFQNVSFLKAFHLEDTFSKRLSGHQKRQKDAALEYNRFSILTSSFMSLMGMVVGGVCFFWSVYRLWGGHITFGQMTLFLQLSGTLSGAFGGLVSLVPSGIHAATAAGRIMEVTQLSAEDLAEIPEISQLGSTGGVSVAAEKIDFAYESGKTVFQNADFQADAGQVVALVGPSGGGKTTLLRLLLGLLLPQKGSLALSGEKVTVPVCASTRNLFAYVPQDNTLFSGTVEENLLLGNPEASYERIKEALETACAWEFVSTLPQGIHTRVGERGNGLSEGQIQRLCIARALLSDAPILLLDEATSALDVDTEHQLLRNVMACRKNRTCIVTTHRPSVLELCDRAYRIEGASIVPVMRL